MAEPRHAPPLPRRPLAGRPALRSWRRAARVLGWSAPGVLGYLAFSVGSHWASVSLREDLGSAWNVAVVTACLGWLFLLWLTVPSLWLVLFRGRDRELLLTLPVRPSRVFWHKWRGTVVLPTRWPFLGGLVLVIWCYCVGVEARPSTFVALPLLVWSNLLVVAGLAALLVQWKIGRVASWLFGSTTLAVAFLLVEYLLEVAGEVAVYRAAAWKAALLYGPWTWALPPRWALEALAAADHQRDLAAGAALGATLGVALLVLAAAHLGLRRTYSWETLAAPMDDAAHPRRPRRSEPPTWPARRLAAAFPRRTRALLRLVTQSPAPERRLDFVLPIALVWTAAGALIWLSETLLWPRFPPGGPYSSVVFLLSFAVPAVAAFFVSAGIAFGRSPLVLMRGDLRHPPAQVLPVGFGEHLRTALCSNLAHLAGLLAVTLPFVLTIAFPFWGYAAFLVLALWVVTFEALGQAAGPRVAPSRRFLVLRRMLGLGLWASPLVFLLVGFVEFFFARPAEEPLALAGEIIWPFLAVATGLLGPIFALRWWWLSRQLMRRRFDVEGTG